MKRPLCPQVLLLLALSGVIPVKLSAQGNPTCRSYFTYTIAGNRVQFINHYVGYSTPTAISWSFGDGTTGSSANPNHLFPGSGVYNTCLIITDASGCQGVYCDYITIGNLNACNASFSIINNQNAYTFQNTSTGSNLSFLWRFGDGSTSTNISPTHYYAPGTYYNVCLIISNSSGCRDTACTSITVSGTGCHASFAYSMQQNVYNFHNTSLGTNLTYLWNFGDGGSSALQNPSHAFIPGTYYVCLAISNSTGCQSTFCARITVPSAGICNAAFSYQSSGQNSYTFINTSTGSSSLTYQWNFGDGTTSTVKNPVKTFTPGIYNVCLIILSSTGCRDTTCNVINVAGTPCTPQTLVLRPDGAAGKDAVVWSTSPSGNSATLTALELMGWTHSGAQAIHRSLLQFDFSSIPAGAVITDARLSLYYDPAIGAGTNGQSGLNTALIKRITSPWNESTVTWNNQPGSTSVNQVILPQSTSPTQDYPNINVTNLVADIIANPSGNFGMLLRLQTETPYRALIFGSSDHPDQNKRPKLEITYCAPCNAAFTFTNQQNTYNFQNTSTGSNLNYNWTFGDGGTSTLRNPSYNYISGGGLFPVCLSISSTTGCNDSFCDSIIISCDANFTYTLTATGVQFNGHYLGINSATSVTWNFGDGTTGTGTNPSHHYSTDGSYYVCMTARDGATGCQDVFCDSVVIPCDVSFNVHYVAGIPFIDGNFSGVSSASAVTWDLDYGNTYTGFDPPHDYYGYSGNYNICVTANDAGTGCYDTFCDSLIVPCGNLHISYGVQGSPPNAPIASGSPVQFYGSYMYYRPSSTITWTFGDGGSTSSTNNPVHTYMTPGTFNACLEATDPVSGCHDIFCDSITIEPCSVSFTYLSSASPLYHGPFMSASPIKFNGTYSGVTSSGSVSWDFGDGSGTSHALNPVHSYSLPGDYSVCVTIQDTATSCQDIFCDSIIIEPCEASFTYSVSGSHVQFTGSFSGIVSASSVSWNFGDGTTGSGLNPVHIYPPGNFNACVTTHDFVTGCQDVFCDSVLVPCYAPITTFIQQQQCTDDTALYELPEMSCETNRSLGSAGKLVVGTSPPGSPTYYNVLTCNGYPCRRITNVNLEFTVMEYAEWPINIAAFLRGHFIGSVVEPDGNLAAYPPLPDAYPVGPLVNFYFSAAADGYFSTWAFNSSYWNGQDPSGVNWYLKFEEYSGDGDNLYDYRIRIDYEACPSVHATSVETDTLTSSTGCDSIVVTETTYLPIKSDSAQVTICEGDSVFAGGDYQRQSGFFADTLTASNGCDSIHTTELIVFPDSLCVPCEVMFTYSLSGSVIYGTLISATEVQFNSSYNGGVHGVTSASTVSWDFGDGTTSSFTNPVHFYPSTGTYYACVTLQDATTGCNDTYCDSIILPCEASFTYSVTATGIQFNGSFSGITAGTSVTWNFGDGSSGTGIKPHHYYTNPGTYYVCVSTHEAGTGCQDIFCDSVVVPSCDVSFTYYLDSDGVKFEGNYAGDESSATFTWDFGNGTSNTEGLSPHHRYPIGLMGNVYHACVTATDASIGCQDVFCDSILIVPCEAGFVYNVTATGVQFNGSFPTINSPGIIWTSGSSLSWTFGDGASSNGYTTTHHYASSGSYTVCVSASASICEEIAQETECDTCTDVFCANVVVTCDASFVYSLSGNTASFTAGFGGVVPPSSFVWTFGDGISVLSIVNPSHVYSNPGTYYTCLTVNDAVTGCQDTYCENIVIDSTSLRLASQGSQDNLPMNYFSEPLLRNYNIEIFPNPTENNLNLGLSVPAEVKMKLVITDMSGKQVLEQSLQLMKGKQLHTIDLSTFRMGVYMLRIEYGIERKIFKIVKI